MDRSIRKYDTTFRYGGEEFVILLPDSSFEDIAMVADRVRQAVENLRIEADSQILSVTISMGVAFTSGNEATTWKQLFEEADKQLYRAKKEGRNRVCYSNGHKTSVGAPIVTPLTSNCDSQPTIYLVASIVAATAVSISDRVGHARLQFCYHHWGNYSESGVV